MKEQESPEAGILEKLGVRVLLWVEQHLEAKPQTSVNLKRRQFLKRATLGSLGIVLATSGGVRAFQFLVQSTPETTTTIHSTPVPTPIPTKEPTPASKLEQIAGYYGAEWLAQPAVISQMETVKRNPNLLFLDTRLPFRFGTLGNLYFHQPSNGALLAIDKKSLEEWLSQQQTLEQKISFLFTDRAKPAKPFSGTPTFSILLDRRWQTQTQGYSQALLLDKFSYDLSSIMALDIEHFINNIKIDETNWWKFQFGTIDTPINPTSKQRYLWYYDQFTKGAFKPFIRVIAVNPQWVKEKFAQ